MYQGLSTKNRAKSPVFKYFSFIAQIPCPDRKYTLLWELFSHLTTFQDLCRLASCLKSLLFSEDKNSIAASDLQARQAWDFISWIHQASGLDLSSTEISCLQVIDRNERKRFATAGRFFVNKILRLFEFPAQVFLWISLLVRVFFGLIILVCVSFFR